MATSKKGPKKPRNGDLERAELARLSKPTWPRVKKPKLVPPIFPQDGVYLVTSGAKDSRRIASIGAVPDPMDLARLEVLRPALEKAHPALTTTHLGNLLDILFPLIAREAHEQAVLESVEKTVRNADAARETVASAPDEPGRGACPQADAAVEILDRLEAARREREANSSEQASVDGIAEELPLDDEEVALRDRAIFTTVMVLMFALIAIVAWWGR